MAWKCNKCGKCCEVLAQREEWRDANLSKLDTKRLLWERKRNRRAFLKKGCEMLFKYGNDKLCLIHAIFGFRAKPKECQAFGEKECTDFLNRQKRGVGTGKGLGKIWQQQ